jgi:nucleotide-binding universal stress UspA family protein
MIFQTAAAMQPPIVAFATEWHEDLQSMKTITAAVDFSDATLGVLKLALSLAHAYGAELQLFHAVEPQPSHTAYGFSPEEFPVVYSCEQEAIKQAQLRLAELAATLKPSLPQVSSHVIEGPPLPALLEFSRENGSELVVLGNHSHGALASLLLGGVAEGMLRKSGIPTLIVPASAG